MVKHWPGVLCLGVVLGGCVTTPLPEPVAVADPKSAAAPRVSEAVPLIKQELERHYQLNSRDAWEFTVLKAVNGIHEAKEGDALAGGSAAKRYAGWFMCGLYRQKNDPRDTGAPFMAYFNPADGSFLYLITERKSDTASGCNRLYGTTVLRSEWRRRY